MTLILRTIAVVATTIACAILGILFLVMDQTQMAIAYGTAFGLGITSCCYAIPEFLREMNPNTKNLRQTLKVLDAILEDTNEKPS